MQNIYKLGEDDLNSIFSPLRKFVGSVWYRLLLFVGATVFTVTGKGVLGTYIFSILITGTMFIGDDIIPGLEGILVCACFAIRLKYSTEEFVSMWPLSLPVFFFFFSHFFLYPKRIQKGALTTGMLGTSLAIVIGGVGVIYWKTYFSPTSLFYMCLLGFGMVLIYSYVLTCFEGKNLSNIADRFSVMMADIIPVMCMCLGWEYFSRRDEFLESMSTIPFQWRNNAATLLMLSMPFAFYFAVKKYRYFFLGILSYIAIVFTGSRGGLIFGAAELCLCVIYLIIVDKKHRKHNLFAVGVCLVAAVILRNYITEVLSYTIERLKDPGENKIRIELYERGIKDFLSNPINGRGLAYMGNRDIHASAKHALCWYHCSLIQVIASFGITGVIAYGYLNFRRIKLFIGRRSHFTCIMFLSFIGLEMMSLVNPGIFVPFPYLFMISIYFALMEKYVPEETHNESIVNR